MKAFNLKSCLCSIRLPRFFMFLFMGIYALYFSGIAWGQFTGQAPDAIWLLLLLVFPLSLILKFFEGHGLIFDFTMLFFLGLIQYGFLGYITGAVLATIKDVVGGGKVRK